MDKGQSTRGRGRKKKLPVPNNAIEEDGLAILIQMSQDDLELFLNNMDTQCPVDDTKQLKGRFENIDWTRVSFSCYGPHQCKAAWTYLQAKARKFRIMHEVVEEVKVCFKADYHKLMRKAIEASPDFPRQPYAVGAFQFYCKELWDAYKIKQGRLNEKIENFLSFQTNCYQKWQQLPANRQQKYDEKAKLLNAEYKRQVKEFYLKYPKFAARPVKLNKNGKKEELVKPITKKERKQALQLSNELYKDAPQFPLNPVQLFMNSKLNDLDPAPTSEELPELKAHYFERWKNLSNKKRLKWIKSCIKKSEQYLVEIREYKKTRPLFLLPKEFQISKLISRDEFNIWAEANGKPPSPKINSEELFYEKFRKENEGCGTEDELRSLAHKEWEKLSRIEKDVYKANLRLQGVTFRKEFEEYYYKLPHLLRTLAADTLPKKYKKAFLEDVDKEPLVLDDEEPEIISQNTQGTSQSTELSRKRKKAEGESENEEDGDPEEMSGKKRKKGKKKEKDAEKGTERNIPLYTVELTSEHKKLLQEKMNEAKNKKSNQEIDEQRNTSLYTPGKEITTRMLNEAIRGIFDGWQMLGRRFSVYYYFAKYVAKQASWRTAFTKYGVVYTAGRVIETFHRLGRHQQGIFITEASNFHTKDRHYPARFAPNQDLLSYDAPIQGKFKAEPKPPPCNVRVFYKQEMEKDKKSNPRKNIKWDDLNEETQMFYIKRFYRHTKKYIKEYENFVKTMSPNEMIEYLIRRCSVWESKKVFRSVELLATVAHDPYPSNTYSLEMSHDEEESEPEILEVKNGHRLWYQMGNLHLRFKHNPFSIQHDKANKQNKNALVRNLRKKKKDELLRNRNRRNKRRRTTVVESDLPSSTDEDDDPGLTSVNKEFSDQLKKKRFESQLKEMQRYYYPLEEFYDISTNDNSSKVFAEPEKVAKTLKDKTKGTGKRAPADPPTQNVLSDHEVTILENKLANPIIKTLVKYVLSQRNNETEFDNSNDPRGFNRMPDLHKTKSKPRIKMSAKISKKAKLVKVKSSRRKELEEKTGSFKEPTKRQPSFVLVSPSPCRSLREQTSAQSIMDHDLSKGFPNQYEHFKESLDEGGARAGSSSSMIGSDQVNLEDFDPQLFSMDQFTEAELSQFNVATD